MQQICRIEFRHFQQTIISHIDVERLAIERNFNSFLRGIATDCDSDINLSQAERVDGHITPHLVDSQPYI